MSAVADAIRACPNSLYWEVHSSQRRFSCGSSPEGSHWPMREVPGCQRLSDKLRGVICAPAPPAGPGRGLATPELHLCSSFLHLTQPATPVSLERASSINHKHRNPHLTHCFQGSLPSTPAHLGVTAPVSLTLLAKDPQGENVTLLLLF